MERIERAQRIILKNLCLQDDETLVVITDDSCREVGALFYQAARALKQQVQLIQMPDGRVSGEEPPQLVALAMQAADVALCATSASLTHTQARIQAAALGTRVVTMPGITLDMLDCGAACAHYDEVESLTHQVTHLLSSASYARIEKEGHVLELDLRNRRGVASTGVYRASGECGNFPSGEAYIAPQETNAQGSMLIDGSMVGIGILSEPLLVHLENGKLTSVAGSHKQNDYRSQLDVLFASPENSTIAELGIGTNHSAQLSGIILEDEKLFGTVHIAFGTNTSFGGNNKATCHYDGIILKPTLYLDDVCLIREGVFQTDALE